MKKLLAAIAAVSLALAFAGCSNIMAPEDTAEPIVEQAAELETAAILEPSKPLNFTSELSADVDLDMDGAAERVNVGAATQNLETNCDEREITVASADGKEAKATLGISYLSLAAAYDIDRDGAVELFFSGDVMSNDYETWICRYQNGELVFAEGYYEPEQPDDGPAASLYGSLEAFNEDGTGTVSIGNNVDILGTWWGSTQYRLNETAFKAERVANSVWTYTPYDGEEEYWTYDRLITARELPVVLDGESEETMLPVGSSLLMLDTDQETYFHFKTKDGKTGRVTLERNTDENGWGFSIAGVHESEYFESVPYAG